MRRTLLVVAALLLPAPVAAQSLYKLVDRNGRVTYSDTAPKNFDGTVTRIEPDAAANLVPSSPVPGAGPAGTGAREAPAAGETPNIAEQRRKAREALDKRVRAAQAKVDAARKAKEEGESPRDDELQTIQHRLPPLRSGQAAPRPNCFAGTDPHGNAVLNCPTTVPQDTYYERRRKLDEALRLAEEELAAAELAYRRGTD